MSANASRDARDARARPMSTRAGAGGGDDVGDGRIEDGVATDSSTRLSSRLRRRRGVGRAIVLTCALACALAARPTDGAYYANRRLGAAKAGVQRQGTHGVSAYDGVSRTSKHANYVGDEIKRHVSFTTVDMPEISASSASGASAGDAASEAVDAEGKEEEKKKPKRRNAIRLSPEEAKKLRERLGIATDAEKKEEVKKESLIQKQALRGKAGRQRRNAISLSSAEAKQLRDELTPSENEVIESTPEEERSDGGGDGANDDAEDDGDGDGK